MAGKRDFGPAGLTARGRPALLAGGVAPLAQHALPLGEGKKELSRSSTTSRTTRASRCARASPCSSCMCMRPYRGAGRADCLRPAGAVGRGIAPSAWRALPLGEGKKKLSRSSTTSGTTRASRHVRVRHPVHRVRVRVRECER